MRTFIDDVQNFKDALGKTGLAVAKAPDIPKVILLGNEKSGKSSILEKLIDSSVYIKGQKVDRPILVETFHVEGLDTWFEIEDLKGSKFLTGDDLGTELIKSASSMGFSENECLERPVTVKFSSFQLCGNITFVDFPGIKLNDSWNTFRDFVTKEYGAEGSDCLLIGVVPITDLNNQARVLKLLGDLDPQRLRSSLILTKLDLVSIDDIQRALDSFIPTFANVVGVGNIPEGQCQKDVLCVDKFDNKIHAAIPKFAPYENHLGLRAARVMISNLIAKHVRNSVTSIRDKLQKQIFQLQRNCYDVKALYSARSDVSVSTLVKTFGDSLNKALCGCVNSAEPKDESIELTEGARINLIFQKTLVNRLRNINSAFNESDNRQVVYAIKNSRAIRTGFFIPDKAFNTVARQRIEKFRLPFMNCLKDIIVQVKSAINRCGRITLQTYPLLLDEITRKCTEYVLANDMLVQDSIDSALKVEECYINSANEDFAKQVERANALAEDGHSFKVKRSIMSTNLHKSGTLSILQPETKTKHKFWFVLSSDELQWFKHKDKKTFVANLKLENLRLMDGDLEGSICMFYLTGKRVSEDYERLTLVAENEDDCERWKTQLLRAGVFPVNDSFLDLSNDIFLNGQLNESVALIRHLTIEYMKIVKKNLSDKFTKIVVHYLINRTKEFVMNDLLLYLFSLKKDNELLKTSSDADSIQKKQVHDYEATKEAIKLADNLCFSQVQPFFTKSTESTHDIMSRTFGDDFLTL
ncbi:dynamin-2-like [Convolutriloba macropyga]|uniref:dynamin-2-like n=1 Tax=Convolutriloba macropyga TaxID=536237 RepID=UPI003F51AF37